MLELGLNATTISSNGNGTLDNLRVLRKIRTEANGRDFLR